MKRLLLIGVFALGGCAGVTNAYDLATGSYVTANDVYIAANAFDAAENAAKAYDSLPACGSTQSVACRQLSVVKAIGKAVRSGRVLRNQLEGYVTANPGQLVPISNYNALMAAVSTIQSYTGGTK